MFEKEIKFIGDFSFNQVRSIGNNFTLEKMINTGIHPAIVQYISAELEYMIYSDRKKLLQQSYFDYTGKEISDHFQKISGEIKRHKKISVDDAKKLIFQAVSFNINYLVRPRWSLIKLIFNDQPVISVEEMKIMFNYLYYYEYFNKVLTAYIEKRNLLQLSSTEFDIILDKIDRELLNSNQQQVISNSFASMGDFFNIGGVDKNLLPLSAVEIFCKEKNLLDLIVKLRKVIPNDIKRRYDKIEIERLLFIPSADRKSEKVIAEEAEINMDKMVDAIDSKHTVLEPEMTPEELQKSDIETFLSPEEEEALLSLYSEEQEQPEHLMVDQSDAFQLTAEISESVENDKLETGYPESSEQLASALDADLIEHEKEIIEIKELNERVSEKSEVKEVTEELTEEVVDSEFELNEIVEAITDDLKYLEDYNEVETTEEIVEQLIPESINDDEFQETDSIQPGIEKEIVQEMIKDYYGENQTESDIETDSKLLLEDEFQTASKVQNENLKIESLENDLLNIFQDLDKFELALPEKGKQFENTDPEVITDANVTEESPVSETSNTDKFDDYLKSIDDLIFTEKSVQPSEQNQVVADKNNINQVLPKAEFNKAASSLPDKIEKAAIKTRNIRPKDLFSYLRRKESKKIVSYIFSNDEEDFTNTIERVMDCHSYKEASEILKAVFTSYKISPYSKEAITFTNAVSNYFRQA